MQRPRPQNNKPAAGELFPGGLWRAKMNIYKVTAAEEKKTIARQVLEALPEWFGIPEAREEYIADSA